MLELKSNFNSCDESSIPSLSHFFYTEDLRISRILRRLLTETNPAVAAEICEKLEIAVRSPSNVAYICRSLEMLLDNIVQILKQCPLECVLRVSNILGIIGFVSRSNFPIYKNFISKIYQSSKSLQKYLILALKSTFRCDAVNLDLAIYSERILEMLIDYLENAEKAETFIAVSETIVEFSKNYEQAFSEHFTDVVDIVVGWHLEADQPQSLKLHCSLVLQKWAAYFLNELNFTYGLLGQFLEDINAWYEDLITNGASKKAKCKAELRIAAFIGAFTTILKSLSTPTEFVGTTTDFAFMENAVRIILKAAKEAFVSIFVGEEIVYNVNDLISSLLASHYEFNDIEQVEDLIRTEIQHIGTFNIKQIETLLYTVLCLVRHRRTALSCSMITVIFSIDNALSALKLTQDQLVYKQLLKIYHEILMLKNVPILQEAYKHIKTDIDDAIQVLSCVSERNMDDCGEFASAMQKLHFYFSALAVLATQSSSIISMYALDPSILKLLIHNCKATDASLWSVEPTLYNALLQLLAVHCQKSRNFITTSRLLNEQPFASQVLEKQSRSSPSSEHFTQILQFFVSTLENSKAIGFENLRLLLKWLQQLLHECSAEHMPILLRNDIFLRICKNLCKTSTFAPIECADCIRVLLKTQIPIDIQIQFKDIAIFHLNSIDDDIVQSYANILSLLPLKISFLPTNLSDESAQQFNRLYELQKWYRGTNNFASLRFKYFTEFLDYLNVNSSERRDDTTHCRGEYSASKIDSILFIIFSKCFINQTEYEKSSDYQKMSRQQIMLVTFWMQFEAARYCVRNKLRTTVGKPQETFLAIEAIIMKYARMLSSKEIKEKEKNHSHSTLHRTLELQHKARILLGFLECLEKNIYNAAQGTAFALPPVEKPAKSFFRINASTCNEWFKRIRSAVCIIAANCMEPELVIRYSEQTLSKKDQINNSALLEHTLINVATALLQRREGDSLHGLHIWLRNNVGKDFVWLQYAAEQANGQFEQAAIGYKSLLEENHMRLDGQMRQFILEQIMYCLYYTGQWMDMERIIDQNSEKDETRSILMSTYSTVHLKTMEELCYGIESKFSNCENSGTLAVNDALLQLMNWSTCEQDRDNSTSISNFSCQKTLRKLENVCIMQTFKSNDINSLSNDVQLAIQYGLREGMGRGCNLDERKIEQCEEYIFINHILAKIQNNDNENMLIANPFDNGSYQDNTILMKCLLWTLLLEQRAHASGNYQGAIEMGAFKHSLYLDMAANAREDGNNNCCRRMLKRFFELKGLTDSLEELTARLRNKELEINVSDENLLRGTIELSNCLFTTTTGSASSHMQQQNQCDAINLSSSLCLQIVDQIKMKQEYEDVPYPAIAAKTLLNLSDWLGQRNIGNNSNNSNFNLNNLPQLQELLKNLPETSVQLSDDKLNVNMPAIDKAIGRLINASISQRNDAGNAWLAYGNWCYRWGKKLVELKNSENQALATQITDQYLSERDLKDIKSTFEHNISDEVLHQIANLLQQYHLGKADVVDDEIEANDMSSVETIEQELRKLDSLSDISEEEVTSIIRIWRRTHKTVYAYYETAIRAYLKYLSIETSDTSSNKINIKDNVEDSGFVTTTLRLLRLVVKHAFALQDVLEEGLNSTPLRPWRVIIPQLFSRLNHDEAYVRNSLAQLLCRLAQQEPHAVIFPAVVGSQEEGTNSAIISAKKSAPAVLPNNALKNCFSSLVSSLAKQAPETVRHVQMLVKELRRVALLWEDYWIHALSRLLSEYSSLFSGLVIETRKCNASNEHQMMKLKAKHELLLQYLVTDLKKIVATTNKAAETKYEKNFREHYQQYIDQTLEELTKPETIDAGPIESWQKLKNLYHRFQQRSMHPSGTAASTLKIADLSPILAKMHNTAISMPGLERSSSEAVYIQSIEVGVHILPTKTRPKKLVFLGSDGRKYTYLLKGLEDLHLDERIMQFLSISNLMMERTPDRRRQLQSFRAHYYSVIPLGPQSGLISWVEGVTPLFAIYKKWQQRDAALKQQLNKERPHTDQQQTNLAQPEISVSSQFIALRPSELFYKKLRPLLAAQNIKLKDPRKQWPIDILRRVLDELTEETPRDLLSKELWCHATSAAEWRKTVRNYIVSMAVMSVIGYIVGLGDRHLDNILINLVTGEIVHIDYNVCFEKGKTFRVPEKVPFRLTPNFENALGVTGVEGSYRLGCEYVLRTLRKEKETLLTLLEAFVYDPLVDWTVNDNDGVDDAEEWEQMQQNIKTELDDMKKVWRCYMYDVQKHVSKIDETAQDLNLKLNAQQNAEEELNKLHQQVAKIRELEVLGTAIGSHSLNTITHRFQACKNDQIAFETLQESARMARNDIETLLTTYFDRILGSNGTELKHMKSSLLQQETVFPDEFELVRVYVQQMSEKLYEDAHFARQEMDNSLLQEKLAAMECIQYMDQYARIMQFYPRSRLRGKNCLYQYREWYQQLLDDKDIRKVQSEVNRNRSLKMKNQSKLDGYKTKITNYASAMKKCIYELNMNIYRTEMNELNMQQEQIATVESVIAEIKDFASLDNNTCSTLQGAMLLVLTETLTHLEPNGENGDSPNLFKEIDFIDNLEFVFEQLRLIPRSQQQLSEQKMLIALRNVLQALHGLENDSIGEKTVRLFFLDDHAELQDYILKLCSGNINIPLPNSDNNDDGLKQLCSLLMLLQYHFDKIEIQLQQLKHVIKEILDIEACSWYNILLERLSIIKNLSDDELTAWKKETVYNLFCTARDQVNSWKTNKFEAVYDVCQLNESIRHYIKTVHAKYLNGVSIALIEAYISSFQSSRVDHVDGNAAARLLCNKLVKSIQHNFELEQLRLQKSQKTKDLDHYSCVASAYFWANKSLIENDDANDLSADIVAKEKLLSVIGNTSQSLSAWKHTIIKIQEEISQHTEIVKQRLRWAVAGNANSDEAMNEIVSRFDESSAVQTSLYNFYLQLAKKLIDYSNVVLQFESLMDDSVAGLNAQSNMEDAFCERLELWQQSHSRCTQSSSLISSIEASIVQLLDPEDKIDSCWIANITGLLDELIFAVQRNLNGLEDERKAIQDQLYLHSKELQNLIDNPIRTEMRQFLRTIMKNSKHSIKGSGTPQKSADESGLSNLTRGAIQSLKILFGKLGDLKMKLCLRDDYSEELLTQLNEKIQDVKNTFDQHWKELNGLAQHYLEQSPKSSSKSASPAHLRSFATNKKKNADKMIIAKDETTLVIDKKGEQKRNVYAVSVWKRIRMKLEGRDPDINRRNSVAEQVDYIIAEATNRDNLAVLYEGWTPWV